MFREFLLHAPFHFQTGEQNHAKEDFLFFVIVPHRIFPEESIDIPRSKMFSLSSQPRHCRLGYSFPPIEDTLVSSQARHLLMEIFAIPQSKIPGYLLKPDIS
jgi:hypothetical protein